MKLKLKFKCTGCCNNRVFIANASAQQEPQPSVWRRFGTWLNDFSDQQKPFSEFILVLVWPGLLKLQEEHRVNFCQWRTKWKKKIISKRLLYPVKQLCLLLFEASESKQIRGFNAQLESPQWIDLTPRLENTHLAAVCQLFGRRTSAPRPPSSFLLVTRWCRSFSQICLLCSRAEQRWDEESLLLLFTSAHSWCDPCLSLLAVTKV